MIEKKSYKYQIKVRKMASTIISPEGLEVRYMTFGIGSKAGNVEDGINVCSTYKIIKNLATVATLHGEIDI